MGNTTASRRDANLELPELQDTSIYSSYIANRRSAVLTVAVKLDVFKYIQSKGANGVSVHDLCKKYDLSKRGAEAFVLGLRAMGLVRVIGSSAEEQVSAKVGALIADIRSVAAKVPALSSIVSKTAPAAPAPPHPQSSTPTPDAAPTPAAAHEGDSKTPAASPHNTPPKPKSASAIGAPAPGAPAGAAGQAKSRTPTGGPPSPGTGPVARYSLTDAAALYLVPGEPFYLGGLIAMEFDHFITPHSLLISFPSPAPAPSRARRAGRGCRP
eukprot:tig00001086_g6859.t1